MIKIVVVKARHVHRVGLSQHCRNIYQREIARRGDSTRRYHLAEVTFGDGVRRPRAKHQPHNPVHGRRRTAALWVTNNYRTRIVGRITRDSPRQNFSDAPKPRVAKGVMTVVYDDQLTIFRKSTLSDDDHRVTRVLRIAGMHR